MSHARMREMSPYDLPEGSHSWPRWDVPPEAYAYEEQWKRAQAQAGPSGTTEASKWDKRRRTIVDRVEKLRKEAMASRDQIVHDSLTQLQGSHIALLAVGHPTHPDYLFRLSELSIQRDIQLAAIKQDCESRRHVAQRLYDMEVERIEDEHELAKKGVKERLLEACEERTKKLRDEKDGVELNLDNIFDTQTRPHATRQHRNNRAAHKAVGGYSELTNGGGSDSQPLSRGASAQVALPPPAEGGPGADMMLGFSLLPNSPLLSHLPSSTQSGNGNNNAWLSTLAALPYRASGRGRRTYASSANMPSWFTNPTSHGLPSHTQQYNVQPGKYDFIGKSFAALKAIPTDDVSSDLDAIRKRRRTNNGSSETATRRSAARKYDRY